MDVGLINLKCRRRRSSHNDRCTSLTYCSLDNEGRGIVKDIILVISAKDLESWVGYFEEAVLKGEFKN